jgi:ATP-binding cassette subfamily F protein 3
MLLQCNHIDKSFQGEPILEDITFHLEEKQKMAIVGVNGSGKSTLLKIIMQEQSAEHGDIIIRKDAVIGYLAQEQKDSLTKTVWEEMLDAKNEVIQIEKQLQEITEQMNHETGDTLNSLILQHDRLLQNFEKLDGYAYHSEILGVLKGLGFEEDGFSKPVCSLSGGERTRVALAKMFLSKPDLMILDEPTNHLEMKAIHWLEGYLASYPGAVLLVAHDRYFLDKIVSCIVEIRQHKSYVYEGNYSQFSKKKQALLMAQRKQYENTMAARKHQEEAIEKLRSFNREKSIKRAESHQKMLDHMTVPDAPEEENTQMDLVFSPRRISGNQVLTVNELSKSFDGRCLFQNLSFSIQRGEHVALIGDNGSGKTTILKIITKLCEADAGSVLLGTNVEIGYYDQAHQVLHAEKTIFDEIQDDYPTMTNTQIRNLLASFLFQDDDVFKRIEKLSGGEKGRVSLAKLMLSDANLLLLDEPTNHLDMDSKEILEHAIRQFEGTVLYVSHDRYFINQTATRILDLTQKQLVNYIGNYDYYLEKKEACEQAQLLSTDLQASSNSIHRQPSSSQAKIAVFQNETKGKDNADKNQSEEITYESTGRQNWEEAKAQQNKKRKIEQQLKKAETAIEKAEHRLEEITHDLNNPANGTDIVLLQKLTKEQSDINAELETLLAEWEMLSEQN